MSKQIENPVASIFKAMNGTPSPTKPPCRYRAKSNDSEQWYEGYYVEYPETTYCFVGDGKPPIKHCLVFHQMTDWGLPNRLMIATIDPATLEPIKEG